MTDDLAMKALSGTPADLACQALAAGCDIALFCSGEPGAHGGDLLATCPESDRGRTDRLAAARALAARRRRAIDPVALAVERDRLLA